jgi:hypothetical protein
MAVKVLLCPASRFGARRPLGETLALRPASLPQASTRLLLGLSAYSTGSA